MKVVQLNAVADVGSTGRICLSIGKYLEKNNAENHILYSLGQSGERNAEKISTDAYIRRQATRSRLLGNYGFNSAAATRRIIARLDKLCPDILHLHNIHGHDCNLKMLFEYLFDRQIKVVWTFHDCWAFTAYCPHFLPSGCDRWQTGCRDCPERGHYSLFFDRSEYLFNEKRRLLENADFTIVTPSDWLREQVGKSFLKRHRVAVIPNGIDPDVFHPRASDFRKQYGIPEYKKIVLGAAFNWSGAKGLDVFVDLADRLDPKACQIVLVGTDDRTEAALPGAVIPIRRTKDAEEMARIYSAADVFVNPTRADTFPTVNMEALACGLPVVTFNTGGSPEILTEDTGIVVEQDDLSALEKAIRAICENGAIDRERCAERAKELTAERQCERYYELYRELLGE